MFHGNRSPDVDSGLYCTVGRSARVSQPSTGTWNAKAIATVAQ